MQTFLPYPDFVETAKVLDYRRLGKQRIEAKQILQILLGEKPNSKWANHPCTKMWRGYENALITYAKQICIEWRGRGYKDEQLPWFEARFNPNLPTIMPPWMGNEDFHLRHRSNLVRKKRDYYLPIFGDISDNLEYLWGTSN